MIHGEKDYMVAQTYDGMRAREREDVESRPREGWIIKRGKWETIIILDGKFLKTADNHEKECYVTGVFLKTR